MRMRHCATGALALGAVVAALAFTSCEDQAPVERVNEDIAKLTETVDAMSIRVDQLEGTAKELAEVKAEVLRLNAARSSDAGRSKVDEAHVRRIAEDAARSVAERAVARMEKAGGGARADAFEPPADKRTTKAAKAAAKAAKAKGAAARAGAPRRSKYSALAKKAGLEGAKAEEFARMLGGYDEAVAAAKKAGDKAEVKKRVQEAREDLKRGVEAFLQGGLTDEQSAKLGPMLKKRAAIRDQKVRPEKPAGGGRKKKRKEPEEDADF